MKNRHVILLPLLALTYVTQILGSEQPNGVMRFILRVTTSNSGAPQIIVKEADDITVEDNAKRLTTTVSMDLLKNYKEAVLEAHKEQLQKDLIFKNAEKSYAVEITPIVKNNGTCEKLTVFITESNQ